MSDIVPSINESNLAEHQPLEYCDYCGKRLNPLLYFCTACSTPYKSVENLLSKKLPTYYSDGDMIQLKAPKVWQMFWVYFSFIIGMAIVSILIWGQTNKLESLLTMSVVFFIITCVYAFIYWRTLLPQFKRIGLFQPAGLLGIAALLPLLTFSYFATKFLVYLGMPEMNHATTFREAGVSIEWQVVLMVIFPAITEEIAFRGLLQHWLVGALKPFRAIVVASALFTAMHLSVLEAPYLFAVGMVLGWTKWKTKSLYPSMLIHGLHNYAVIVFFWQ